jgi:preprotein translocase subunit SecG
MLLNILLVVHIIVAVFLTVVVLMQQSEGGALGMGGGPSGFMTARGAGNLLTRITWILFTTFLVLSIGLSVLAVSQRKSGSITGGVEKLDPAGLSQPLPTAPQQQLPSQLPAAPLPSSGLPSAPLPGAEAPAPATTPAAPQ